MIANRFKPTIGTQRFLITLAPLLVCIGLFSCHAKDKINGTNYVVFCSPGLSAQQKDAVTAEFQKFVAGGSGKSNAPRSGMQVGDSIQIFDASSLRQIGSEILIPESARTPQLQYKEAAPLVKAFLEFLRDATLPAAPANIPKLVSTYKEKVNAKDARVLIIASPLYHDDVAAHDMREGWLSDGYFTQPPSVTVFSIKNKESNLRGNTFRICTTLSDNNYGTENKNAHQEMIKRFWAIYLNKCGGALVSFQSDIATGFNTLTKDDLDEIPHEFDPNDKEMVIRRSKIDIQGKISTEISNSNLEEKKDNAQGDTQKDAAINERAKAAAAEELQNGLSWLHSDPDEFNSKNAAITGSSNFDWKTRIGLIWATNADFKDQDLDLYVRPTSSSHELCFNHTESQSGRHLKDFPADSIAKYGFEIVDLTSSVSPKDLQIWINAYSGSPKNGFRGELRVLHNGVLKSYPVKINATSGNKGGDSKNRNRSKYWASVSAE